MGFESITVPVKVRAPDPYKWSQFIEITLNQIESKNVHSNPIVWSNASVIEEDDLEISTPNSIQYASNLSTVITKATANSTPNTMEKVSNDNYRSSCRVETNSRWMVALCVVMCCFVNNVPI